MNKTIIWAVVAVVAAGAIYFALTANKAYQGNTQTPAAEQPGTSTQTQKPSQTQNQMPPSQTPQDQPQTQVPPAASVAVEIKNFAFSPAALAVNAGDTVIWTNNDSVPHQIKSSAFNSAPLSNGQTFSFTFDKAGTYDYSCAIHPSMKGQIVVR